MKELRNIKLPQVGQIAFEGLQATKFWIRTLSLQKEIDTALSLIAAKGKEGDVIVAAPIIAEYQVDERFKFVFIIMAEIDQLGLRGGSGIIYFTSPDREEEVCKVRDKFADEIMEEVQQHPAHQIIVVEDGKERGRE